MKTAHALFCGVICILLIALAFGCAEKEETEVIKIGAVFAVTGPAAKLGGPEKKIRLK